MTCETWSVPADESQNFESFSVYIADPPDSKVDIRVIYSYSNPDFSPKLFDLVLLQSPSESRVYFT